MIPASFPEANSFLNVDKPLLNLGIEPLACFRGTSDGGVRITISCWKLTEPEWEELQRTKRIYLSVLGDIHPPVSLSPLVPFREKSNG